MIQIDPKNINALNTKGLAYYNLEVYYKAIDCFDKALHIDQKYINALFNKG